MTTDTAAPNPAAPNISTRLRQAVPLLALAAALAEVWLATRTGHSGVHAYLVAGGVALQVLVAAAVTVSNSRTASLAALVASGSVVCFYVSTGAAGGAAAVAGHDGHSSVPVSPVLGQSAVLLVIGLNLGIVLALLSLLDGAQRRWAANAALAAGVALIAVRFAGVLP